MKNITVQKRVNRTRRHARVRAKITGTAQRPRVSVFKSNRHLFVQVVDDVSGTTLASSKIVAARKSKHTSAKTELAKIIGGEIAEKMKEKGITSAVFDTGGFKYHGRVQAVAEGLRAEGIKI